MKSDERLKFKVTSTEGHKEFFTTRKEAEKYVRQLRREKQVGAFVEFRIFEVDEE